MHLLRQVIIAHFVSVYPAHIILHIPIHPLLLGGGGVITQAVIDHPVVIDPVFAAVRIQHGKNVKLRKEIAIAIKECMLHEGIFGVLVSHGSSTVPRYIVDEINALGGNIQNAYGISIDELKAAIPCGIGKINVDTDIRLAVTRNMKEFFAAHPEKRESQSIGEVYRLLEAKKEQFDPRAFLTPIMDTVMYGVIPDEDVAALMAVVEKGVKEAIGTLIVEFGSYGKAPLVEMTGLDEMAERYRKGL